jgi:hypothetical protein
MAVVRRHEGVAGGGPAAAGAAVGVDVREIIVHVIAETAVHAGHLDAARELIDGRTWLGPPGSRVPRD